ncbi:hypothetical protein SLE2022_062930 [Rubroshorea leprosula]
MKETSKRRTPNNVQSKRTARTERKGNKQHQENGVKALNVKENQSKTSNARLQHGALVSDSNTGSEPSEVYKNMVIHYVDDANRSEEILQDSKVNALTTKVNKNEILDDCSSDLEGDSSQGKEEESDTETIKDSASSQGDSLTNEDEKVERASGVDNIVSSMSSSGSCAPGSRMGSDGENNKAESKTPKAATNFSSEEMSRDMKVPTKPSSETSEEVDNKNFEEMKEIDVSDEASNGAQSIESDNEPVYAEGNVPHEDETALNEKIEEMEMRVEKLEEELREVAALEISLYSVVPEHGSSAHKVHTPARRLSRLYIHACKQWTQSKRATIAKNTVSGLILIAKSCGNDVSRLTFWLSNTIVLREIISQAFGSSRNSNPVTKLPESNGSSRNEVKSTTLKWKVGASSKQVNNFVQLLDDWQDTGTFTSALEKVESWIFSRIVESVWWQAVTPYMQSPAEGSAKMVGKLLGPALGDQQQESFSINLWKAAFQDAFQRICPVRAGGHECGCLSALARMVMEQCVSRLDVAMFNAILRESAHEIPTDPVSDPIVDSKVLPIPAGDLSFGSGAQLKNSVGNWSRWLADKVGMDAGDSQEEEHNNDDDFTHGGEGESKSFVLLNELSDLLMLPKDMLMDRSIRMEVCPSISLSLVKRILCNFTPDEFCPDAVPGAVLEALNAESFVERRISGESARSFPYTAAPVVYTPPSTADVAKKVAEAGERSQLSRNVSMIQRKGYTSDEELEELDSPLASIVDKLPPSPTIMANGKVNGKHDHASHGGGNVRFELLREVWSF